MASATIKIEVRHPWWQALVLWLNKYVGMPNSVAAFLLRFGYVDIKVAGSSKWERILLRGPMTPK